MLFIILPLRDTTGLGIRPDTLSYFILYCQLQQISPMHMNDPSISFISISEIYNQKNIVLILF